MVEWPQGDVLYLVLAVDLVYHQFGIGIQRNLPGAQAYRFLQSGDDGAVFRLVIGGDTETAGDAGDIVAFFIVDDGADGRRSRIAAGRAVCVYRKFGCVQINFQEI